MSKRLTAVIHREGTGFVALCPELDVASRGIPSKRLGTTSARR